jgi:hypothetical protein
MRHRGKMLDVGMATVVPLIGFLVALSARSSRFDLYEAYGPMPGVHWDIWGIIWVAVRGGLFALR